MDWNKPPQCSETHRYYRCVRPADHTGDHLTWGMYVDTMTTKWYSWSDSIEFAVIDSESALSQLEGGING